MQRQPLKRWLAPGSLAIFHLGGRSERHVSVPARCGLIRLVCLAVLPALLEAVPASAQVQPLGDELQVNTYTTGSQGRPAVGPDGGGGFVVVWHSYTPGVSVQAQRFSSAGMAVGDEFRVNTSLSGNYPKVGPDGGGGFVVVWMGGSSGTDSSGASIQAQRYSSAGMALSTEFQVNTYTTGEQRMPAVSPDGGGGFVVAWRNHYSQGVGGDISAQRYSSAGMALGGEFQVNTLTPNYFTTPAVGPDGGGGFVVAWDAFGSGGTGSGFSIQAQRFGSTGTPLGDQFQVNTYTFPYYYQVRPAVGADGGGGFVVVWASTYAESGDIGSVQAQRYSSAGMALGDQFQVNTYTTGYQSTPAIGPDGSGGFVVVWNSYGGSSGTDSDGSSIQAQRYSSSGTALGDEFQVNSYTTGEQGGNQGPRGHSVGPDGSGGFVVAWDSDGSAGTDSDSSSIQAQRFGPAGPTMTATPSATETATATTTATGTATAPPTETPPAMATNTATATITATGAATSPPTETPSATATDTATTASTPSASSTPATTRTGTPAATPATTSTPSASPVATETRTASATASATPTSRTAILPHASPGTRAALVLSLLALGLAALGMRRRGEAEAGHRGGPA